MSDELLIIRSEYIIAYLNMVTRNKDLYRTTLEHSSAKGSTFLEQVMDEAVAFSKQLEAKALSN